jgi:hypothetical protein
MAAGGSRFARTRAVSPAFQRCRGASPCLAPRLPAPDDTLASDGVAEASRVGLASNRIGREDELGCASRREDERLQRHSYHLPRRRCFRRSKPWASAHVRNTSSPSARLLGPHAILNFLSATSQWNQSCSDFLSSAAEKGVRIKARSGEINCDSPSRVIERADLDTKPVLPVPVALSKEPTLQPAEEIHLQVPAPQCSSLGSAGRIQSRR